MTEFVYGEGELAVVRDGAEDSLAMADTGIVDEGRQVAHLLADVLADRGDVPGRKERSMEKK